MKIVIAQVTIIKKTYLSIHMKESLYMETCGQTP